MLPVPKIDRRIASCKATTSGPPHLAPPGKKKNPQNLKLTQTNSSTATTKPPSTATIKNQTPPEKTQNRPRHLNLDLLIILNLRS
ncbi:hypothetical protein RHMOL_Rhmol11G0090700 [Rhododendron molle]|uniref:Uncharacterized protein n=1 Tax=Rhododendron molle TaxID=49168 RepID=A0ACC0LR99_RHOML|nr:hypothetical protein RHMOL_Rhmol11G0090700 [Rhododendron molle]